MGAPLLSVIVPALDEARAVGVLVGDLARQEAVSFEVVLADGGSGDGTAAVFGAALAARGLPGRVVQAPRGRGRQLNAGVGGAAGEDLLLLHADSRLENPHLLAEGARAMAEARRARGHRVAGHFGVRFLRSAPGAGGAYYFYEAKTRLGRPDSINGDQGMWLSRAYLDELGGLDERLPYLEDARLARRVSATGEWVTLPGSLGTSARRFEVEGLAARQTLNALLRCFDAIGFSAFLAEAPGAYRAQGGAGRLDLCPFLRLAHRLILAEGGAGAARWWWRTGGYVAANAWQLAFALDCRRNRAAGCAPGEGPTPWLDRYDRWVGPGLTRSPGRAAATLVTLAWFYGALALGRARPARP